MAKKKMAVEIELTESQTVLLDKLKADAGGGFDDWACDHSEDEEEDMHVLCNNGLAESILGEQFYITKLGEQFLKS